MIIIIRSEQSLIEAIKGSLRLSNCIRTLSLSLGSLALLGVGICSYLGMDFIVFYEEISDFPFIPDYIYFPFIPQGSTIFLYGITSLYINLYLWWTIMWNVDGGYNIYDKKERIVRFIRWGLPGKNRCIISEVPMNDIKSIRIITVVKEEGFFTRTLNYYSIVYMETIENGFIPLTRIEDDLIPLQIAQKAGDLALFLDVPLLY